MKHYAKSLILALLISVFSLKAMAEPEIYGVYTDDNKTLSLYYGELPTDGTTYYTTSPTEPGWRGVGYEIFQAVTKVVFDESFQDARPYSCMNWFLGFTSLQTIEHIEYLNTSSTVYMNYMFSSCKSLESLDVSGFDTKEVIDMSGLFSYCSALTNIDLTNFDTGNVEKMNDMFCSCKGLKTITLGNNFKTEKVLDMEEMFMGCNSLTNLDLSNFDNQKVKNLKNIFYNCSNLASINLGDSFVTSSTLTTEKMFYGCKSLTSLDISKFNTANDTTMFEMFCGCSSLTTLNVSGLSNTKVKTMSGMFYGCTSLTTLNATGFKTENVEDMSEMFYNCSRLETLDLSSFNNAKAKDFSNIFSGCSKLANITLGNNFVTASAENLLDMFGGCSGLTSIDVSDFNTQNVTDMSCMFQGCCGLKNFNISMLNTEKVECMYQMFTGCTSLENLNVTGLNTSNVTNMGSMFSNLKSIKTLDLRGLNTGAVENMREMFYLCDNLTTIIWDDNFNTENVTNMQGMFSNCKNIKELNINFNTHSVTNMQSMFSNCENLETLTFDFDKFDTQNVEDMSYMFEYCYRLTTLNVSGFNTKKVKDMKRMFEMAGSSNAYSDVKIDILDLRGFDTKEVTDMSYMLNGSPADVILVSSEKWNIDKVGNSEYMLNGCINLSGERCKMLKDFPGVSNFDKSYADPADPENCLLILDGYKVYFESTLDGLDKTTRYKITSPEERQITLSANNKYFYHEDNQNCDVVIGAAESDAEFDFLCWWGEGLTGYTNTSITIPANSKRNFMYTAVLQYKSGSEVEINEGHSFSRVMQYNYPIVFQKADIELHDDISLAGARSINLLGTDELPFEGTFNGNSHTISGLKYDATVGSVIDVDSKKVAQGSGLFGVLGKNARVKNLNITNALSNIGFENNTYIRTLDDLTVPLIADKNAGQIQNCLFSVMPVIDDTNLKNGAKVNLTIAGNNDNEEEDSENQALIDHVAVYLPNIDLQYAPYALLGGNSTDATRECLYRYWCHLANYMMLYEEDLVCPTFASFDAWYTQLSESDKLEFEGTIIGCDFDDHSEVSPLVTDFINWYYADSQSGMRAVDQETWETYLSPEDEGNGVCVIATQNLCRSPGKGRTNKVCSVNRRKSNKSILLNPDKEVPDTEMECSEEEFANGFATYWLNYDEEGYTGFFNKMWSLNTLHPILASAKNNYAVKLAYYKEDDTEKTYNPTPEYAKVGSLVKLFYTDKPKSVLVDGSLLSANSFGYDYLSFIVPETDENVGVVPILVSFDAELTPTAISGDALCASRIYVDGNMLVISNVAGNSVEVSDLAGRIILRQQVTTDNVNVPLPSRGMYIVKVGNETYKVLEN